MITTGILLPETIVISTTLTDSYLPSGINAHLRTIILRTCKPLATHVVFGVPTIRPMTPTGTTKLSRCHDQLRNVVCIRRILLSPSDVRGRRG